jgi:hypothetical protein
VPIARMGERRKRPMAMSMSTSMDAASSSDVTMPTRNAN